MRARGLLLLLLLLLLTFVGVLLTGLMIFSHSRMNSNTLRKTFNSLKIMENLQQQQQQQQQNFESQKEGVSQF